MHVPFINLRLQYEHHRHEIDAAIASVLSEAQFIRGLAVNNFEEAFAAHCGASHCVGTGNGTDSLFLILKALQVGWGDEVITPAFSCMPSAEVISLAGATPVFCDVDARHLTINPKEIERKITHRTKAVIAVHLFGQAAPLDDLMKVCKSRNLFLIEDCAQAHQTLFDNKQVGTFGTAGAFSFYPTKNLGAYGDAGCVITNNDELADTIRRLGNHGALQKEDHHLEGLNSRLDTIQAAILLTKLPHLPAWTDRRRKIAHIYTDALSSISSIRLTAVQKKSETSYHQFCILVSDRESLRSFLNSRGVQTMIHYPQGVPFTGAYRYLNASHQDFPVTADLQKSIVSLPCYAELTDEQVDYVIQCVCEYYTHR